MKACAPSRRSAVRCSAVPDATAEQAAFRAEVARFAAAEIAPHADAWDAAKTFPVGMLRALGGLGWLGIDVPTETGGSGGGPVERCILFEELSRASAAVTLGVYVHTALAAGALAGVAAPGPARAHLPGLLAGERIGAWAYAEPEAGADVRQARLRATRDGDAYVLDGTKLYITNGTIADLILVVARTGGEPGRLRGLSVLLVDGDAPGLERRRIDKLGMRASDLGELVFDGCRVPADRLVGTEDAGLRECLAVLTRGRVAAGAMACGLGRAALDAAVAHVTAREQFGGPLAALQGVRIEIAGMAARLAGARALVYGAAEAAAAGRPFDTEASVAKLVASETATRLAERALHLHGAAGFTTGHDVQRLYRDCKVLEYGEGANEVQREMIARAALGGWRP